MRGPRGQQLQVPGIARSFITIRRSFITGLQNGRRFVFPSRFPCTALISDTVTDAAARTRALARERKPRQRDSTLRHVLFMTPPLPGHC